MFRFAQPEFLYLLALLPVLIVFYIYASVWGKKATKRYGNLDLIRQLAPEVSIRRRNLKFWLLFGAIIAVIFVLARPQFGSKLEKVKRKGVEIMVCMDVSNSMLAQDVTPSRLDKAKQMLSKLTDGFSDDKLGLIVFAGDAFTQIPITSDYLSAKMFLSSISPSMVSSQGTAIGAAINLAVRSFTPSKTSAKTILLITDGENFEDDAVGAAKTALEKGISVNLVGMGLTKGAPVPVDGNNNYMKDNEGNVVISKLNEKMCKEIAAAGQGLYVRADNTSKAFRAVQSQIDKMNKTELESKVYSEYNEQFVIFAWVALILLLIDLLILDKKNKLFRKIRLFSCLLLFVWGGQATFAQKAERKHVREGNELYTNEKYTESEIEYRKSLEVNPRSIEGTFNLGNALYKQKKYPEAAEQYQLLAGQAERLKEKPEGVQRLSQIYHNMGNIFMQQKKYPNSIKMYEASLRLNPTDDETRYNLALAQKLLKDQQKKDQSKKDNKDKDKKKDQDKKDQKNKEQQKKNQDDKKQNKTQEKPQQQKQQMSKDNAQQMLDAFLQDEKNTQEKVKKAKMKRQQRRKTEKQW